MEPITNTGLTEESWPRIVISGIEGFSNILKLRQTVGLYVGQFLWLRKDDAQSEKFIISRVMDSNHVMLRDEDNLGRELDLSIFTGGTLDAPEQSRVLAPDITIQRSAYMEEPLLAFRTAPVSLDGSHLLSAKGQINTQEPELRLLYDGCFNLIEVREFAFDQEKEYTSTVEAVAARNFFIMSGLYPFWFAVGAKFLYYERQMDGSILNSVPMTITAVNRYQSSSVFTPSVAFSISGSTITSTDDLPDWIQEDVFIRIDGGLNDGAVIKVQSVTGNVITADITLTTETVISSLNGTVKVVEVDQTPPTNGSIEATFDGNLGDQLRSTRLTYDSYQRLRKVYSLMQTVTEDDILTPNRYSG